MLNRKLYETELQRKIQSLEQQIEELKDKLENVEEELAAEHHDRLEELHKLRDKIKHKTVELMKASDEVWEDVQEGLEHYWKAVGNEMKSYEGFWKKKS